MAVGTPVSVDLATWETIDAHALEDYPDECCGLVIEDAAGARRAHPCENIQNKLHGADPESHPRDARRAYRMDDLQVMRILDETEKAGGRMTAIYHSHIDCDAYFSEEDQAAAILDGEPAYPGVVYLVVSVVEGEIRNKKAFDWDSSENLFVEVPLAKS